MKRLIKKAKSKKLDSDLANFLYTCISMFTYNTNEVLLNQCLSYLNNINIKDISEDEERRSQDEVQKMTDRFVAEIDKIIVEKEKEIMTV